MSKSTAPLPDWELLLSSAARLQRILPDAVLVGGTAAAIHAGHRSSYAELRLPCIDGGEDQLGQGFATIAGELFYRPSLSPPSTALKIASNSNC